MRDYFKGECIRYNPKIKQLAISGPPFWKYNKQRKYDLDAEENSTKIPKIVPRPMKAYNAPRESQK